MGVLFEVFGCGLPFGFAFLSTGNPFFGRGLPVTGNLKLGAAGCHWALAAVDAAGWTSWTQRQLACWI